MELSGGVSAGSVNVPHPQSLSQRAREGCRGSLSQRAREGCRGSLSQRAREGCRRLPFPEGEGGVVRGNSILPDGICFPLPLGEGQGEGIIQLLQNQFGFRQNLIVPKADNFYAFTFQEFGSFFIGFLSCQARYVVRRPVLRLILLHCSRNPVCRNPLDRCRRNFKPSRLQLRRMCQSSCSASVCSRRSVNADEG